MADAGEGRGEVERRVSLHYAMVPAQPWESLERAWLPLLPEAKRDAVQRLRAAADRNASLLGIALLESALAALGHSFDPGALDYSARGKPRLTGSPDFSISHAAGLVACAVAAAGRIGLDLELAGSVGESTVRQVLGAEERERLARGELAATEAWVMKEAVAKLAGRGIGELRAVTLHSDRASFDGGEFWIRRVALAPSHVAWLAQDRDDGRVTAKLRGAEEFAPLPAAP
jgi:4'-phosphopantetheinyl transferase